jgi:hypothetical protein
MDFHACPIVKGLVPDVGGMVLMGSPTVLINSMMACRATDMVVEIPGGPNPIVMGASNVFIGDSGVSAPSVSAPAVPAVALDVPALPVTSGGASRSQPVNLQKLKFSGPAGSASAPPQPAPPPAATKAPGTTSNKPTQSGPSANKNQPSLTVQWSKPKVTPNHNSSWPPASPPTDSIPAEALVVLQADTTNVPDGVGASITIYGGAGNVETLAKLEVRGGTVVDPATGKPPQWRARAKHNLWNPWNKPFYNFSCEVDYQGLSSSTDKEKKPPLRLLYWHMCVAESSTLAGVLPECNSVAGILNGVADSKAKVQNLTTENITLAQYGSLLRNTYVFHQASHGNALKRSDGSSIPEDDPGESKYRKAEWRSVVHITPGPRFGDAEVKTKASILSVPKYLFYSSTCLTGWEPSFANAMIARGTRNVIAFRRTIPDDEAPEMAKKFYKSWAKTNLNPAKIPDCFLKAGADHYKNMKPILYGAGGRAIEESGLSTLEKAAIAVAIVAAGVVAGVALYKLLN